MDKRIPLVGGAALLAIVLAVVVIGSPDTGGDVVERDIRVAAARPTGAVEEEVVRDGATPRPSASDAEPGTLIGGGAGAVATPFRSPSGKGRVEKVSMGVARRNNPESEWAASSMAPWTEVRRQLSSQGAPAELIDEVQGVLDEIRDLRLDGQSVDFDELAGKQAALEDTVRGSGYMNTVIGEMFDRLGENQARYENGEFQPLPSVKTIP